MDRNHHPSLLNGWRPTSRATVTHTNLCVVIYSWLPTWSFKLKINVDHCLWMSLIRLLHRTANYKLCYFSVSHKYTTRALKPPPTQIQKITVEASITYCFTVNLTHRFPEQLKFIVGIIWRHSGDVSFSHVHLDGIKDKL